MPAKPKGKEGWIQVIPSDVRIKFKDVFDLKSFYKALRQWVKEYQWGDYESKGKGEAYERLYREVVYQDGSKYMEIRWRLFKPAPATPYINYYFDIDYKLVGLKTKEVVKDGQKLKLDSGEIELKFNAWMELKFLTEFEDKETVGSPFLKQVKELFLKRIYSQTIHQREKELYQEVYGCLRFIKEWFKLRRYLPYEESESFFPSYTVMGHEK